MAYGIIRKPLLFIQIFVAVLLPFSTLLAYNIPANRFLPDRSTTDQRPFNDRSKFQRSYNNRQLIQPCRITRRPLFRLHRPALIRPFRQQFNRPPPHQQNVFIQLISVVRADQGRLNRPTALAIVDVMP
ncbi:MAG: hypothetical protein U1D97_13425 [Desulfuromonadales bacterium]|nr:hypothetical protein [Desulfuromonadales bacterium]